MVYNKGEFYVNRELSWVDFNERVLHQATREDVPLLERLKFLGITASNLDEFIMVRFASVLSKIRKKPTSTDISKLTPQEEYDKLLDEIKSFKELQEKCYVDIKKLLEKNEMSITKYDCLTNEERMCVEDLFTTKIYPLLTPIQLNTSANIPHIKSKQLYIVVQTKDSTVSIIPIDKELSRLYEISPMKFMLLEDIISSQIAKLFDREVVYCGTMKLLRDADIELDKNKKIHIVERMKKVLSTREDSKFVFMDIDSKVDNDTLDLLVEIFNMNRNHVYIAKEIVELSFLVGSPVSNKQYEYETFNSQYPTAFSKDDIFSTIENGDVLLHHPFESFDPVIEFLNVASNDDKVVEINQTLYRVSSKESPIIEALCHAANRGKDVRVLLEIKARFDEERNISLIEKLETAGCKVFYGIEGLKTHCKFIYVLKEVEGEKRAYCHIGTGNYNEKNARIYTDLSYFTANKEICEDIKIVFDILSGVSYIGDKTKEIAYSPESIRSRIYQLVDKEIENAENGKEALITIKVNSLSDKKMIQKLYEASEKGVKIDVFSRGICSMKPINDNIHIRSLVGRYLEHSRIYTFHNDGDIKIYISSADLLTRNLDKRVELMVPLNDEKIKEQLLDILNQYYSDDFNTYVMNSDGEYRKADKTINFNVHEYFVSKILND